MVGEGWNDLSRNTAMGKGTETLWDWLFVSLPLTSSFSVVGFSTQGYYLGLSLQGELLLANEDLDVIAYGTGNVATILNIPPRDVWVRAVLAIAEDTTVHAGFVHAFAEAGWGAIDIERLSFVILAENGTLQTCPALQHSGEFQREHSPRPLRAIASFHTHATHRDWMPSKVDTRTGRETNLIMFVLHRRGISAYVPGIDDSIPVAQGRWW
jgi:hypothetical protein